MPYEGYECLRVEAERGVAFVTIDHPPINLFDLALMGEVDRLGVELEGDDEVRVVVFQSANPEFFIAHADVELIRGLPRDVGPRPTELGFFHQAMERFRSMPKVTIGKNCRIINAIIDKGCVIPDGTVIGENPVSPGKYRWA